MSLAREDDLHKQILKRDREIVKLQGEITSLQTKLVKLKNEFRIAQDVDGKVLEMTKLVEKYEAIITDLYGQNVELKAWFDEMVKTVDILKRQS